MDATKIIEKSKPGYVFQNIEEGRIYNVGFNDTGLTGIKAVGTHELAELAEGEALVGGKLIAVDGITSAANTATLKVQVNGEDVTTAATVDNYHTGAVVAFDLTSAIASMAVSGPITVDIVIAVQAVTAGRFILELEIVHVTEILERG